MIRNRTTFGLGAFLIAFVLLNGINIHAVMATRDYQNYNYQILSSNTSNDYNSWARWSVTTYEPFHVSSSLNGYSYQMNTVVNDATYNCGSCGTWWLQGVVWATTNTGGAVVDAAFNSVWSSTTGLCYTGQEYCNFCDFATNENVNMTGYVVLQETTLLNSSYESYLLSISNNSGTNLYHNSQDCPYPSGYSVNLFSREEGTIVGKDNSTDASFSPLSSTIFSPAYLDLVSNYNDMSDQNATTQTGETSNLYQDASSAYGESYGSMYLYTVISSEITKTGS